MTETIATLPPDSARAPAPDYATAASTADVTRHATMHGVGFMLSFGAVCLACLVFARRSLARGERAVAANCGATA